VSRGSTPQQVRAQCARPKTFATRPAAGDQRARTDAAARGHHPGEEATALASLAGLVTVARAAEAEVRLGYVRDLPRPRVDRYDRTVADTDAEMARITSVATRALGAAARVFDDVTAGDSGAVRQAAARGRPRGRDLRAPDRRALRGGHGAAGPAPRLEAAATAGRQPGARVLMLDAPRRPEVRHAGDVAGQERLAAPPRVRTRNARPSYRKSFPRETGAAGGRSGPQLSVRQHRTAHDQGLARSLLFIARVTRNRRTPSARSPTVWRPGSVWLSILEGNAPLIARAFETVMGLVPQGYDIIIRCGATPTVWRRTPIPHPSTAR
jgi:hypothetical protein